MRNVPMPRAASARRAPWSLRIVRQGMTDWRGWQEEDCREADAHQAQGSDEQGDFGNLSASVSHWSAAEYRVCVILGVVSYPLQRMTQLCCCRKAIKVLSTAVPKGLVKPDDIEFVGDPEDGLPIAGLGQAPNRAKAVQHPLGCRRHPLQAHFVGFV